MTKSQRAEFRRALQDELATIRALNSALNGAHLRPDFSAQLLRARADAVNTCRYLLDTLHPSRKGSRHD
ncbi:MAG: hypothetical protein CXZ00_11720 [Acidobacteria bacterium]|nr:MAG: hypothetical protein CXZ00_11720 [Acidobacteriota bacterium]